MDTDNPTINLDAWKEWEEYRAFKKKPVSKFAQAKQWKMLGAYSFEVQQQIIDCSISNDWQGLFPPKGNVISQDSTRERTLEQDLHDRSWAQ